MTWGGETLAASANRRAGRRKLPAATDGGWMLRMIGFTKPLCGQAMAIEAARLEASARVGPGSPQSAAADRPLVVWNVTRRCNLTCAHCCLDAPRPGGQEELNSEEAIALINDLGAFRVPVLLFSGGEPLLRKDTLGLARYAVEKGIRAMLSTNGTLITHELAARIRSAGVEYVGVGLRGLEATHDRLCGCPGAFRAAVAGIQACQAAGVEAGIRFTLAADNLADLPGVLDLAEELRVRRFCFRPLPCAGHATRLNNQDAAPAQWGRAMQLLLARRLDWDCRQVPIKVLTISQSAGRNVARVDALGNIHASRVSAQVELGNVRERKFSDLWPAAAARDP